jgi:hypothetical protein
VKGAVEYLYVNTVGEKIRAEKKNAEMALYFASIINTATTVVYAHQIYTASIIVRNTTAGTVIPINSVIIISDMVNVRSVKNCDFTHFITYYC